MLLNSLKNLFIEGRVCPLESTLIQPPGSFLSHLPPVDPGEKRFGIGGEGWGERRVILRGSGESSAEKLRAE